MGGAPLFPSLPRGTRWAWLLALRGALLASGTLSIEAPVFAGPSASCWTEAFTRDGCCNLAYGPQGNRGCWGEGYSFDVCCAPDRGAIGVEQLVTEKDLADIELELGFKLDRVIAQGATLPDLEEKFRREVASPEDRVMLEATERTYLALVLKRMGQEMEAMAELRRARDSHRIDISPNGAWQGTNAAAHHFHDTSFSQALVAFLKGRKTRNVADFGCGLGLYIKDLRLAGIRAGGFDGNPATREISEGRCAQADLSSEHDFGTDWGWVFSFEVAEHIPRQFEAAFLNNLDRHACDGVIISWANQWGIGHVNNRPPEEVQQLFEELGFEKLHWGTSALREAAKLEWFKTNVQVFKRIQPRC